MTGAEELAAALLAGLGEADPDLAVALDGPDLAEVCGQLAHLMWTPLMIRCWGSHPRWAGVAPEAVLETLRGLGLPPEPPRSAVPLAANVCPEHPGEPVRAGHCDICLARVTNGPPAAFLAARRSVAS